MQQKSGCSHQKSPGIYDAKGTAFRALAQVRAVPCSLSNDDAYLRPHDHSNRHQRTAIKHQHRGNAVHVTFDLVCAPGASARGDESASLYHEDAAL